MSETKHTPGPLIAAAPDLLKRLQHLESIIGIFARKNAKMADYEKLGGWDWERIHADIVADIAKATQPNGA